MLQFFQKFYNLKFIRSLFIILLFQLVATNVFAKIVTLENLKVTKVIDGDTIWVKDNQNHYFKIRFAGINATEVSTVPPEPFSIEAKKEVAKLLNNQIVYAQYETKNKKDKYNRLLAQIYKTENNLWINSYLVDKGLAYVYIISDNIPNLNELLKLENKAIKAKVNLWSNINFAPIKAKDALLFKGHYKIIIGEVGKINLTKKSIWLEITDNQEKLNQNMYNKGEQFVFAIRIPKKLFENRYNWNSLLNKQVKIRGYVEQYKANLLPFVKLINLQNIEIIR